MSEPESGPASEKDQARFWAKVAPPDGNGCMLWLAYVDPDGYGKFRLDGEARRAHRISYVLAYGPIPEGLVLDHLCRVRQCVTPDHLEPVTRGENVLRGETLAAAHLAKTHCHRGHEFTPENTYLYRGKYRRCRTCPRERPENAAA